MVIFPVLGKLTHIYTYTYIHNIYTIYTQYIHNIYTTYTQYIHNIHNIHNIYTIYTTEKRGRVK